MLIGSKFTTHKVKLSRVIPLWFRPCATQITFSPGWRLAVAES